MLKIRFKNNKYSAVWLVEPSISVGSSATNDLVVDDPYVEEKHFEVQVAHENLTLKNLHPNKPVKVNNAEVSGVCTLKEDDEIALGGVVLVVVDPKRESKVVTQEAANTTQLRPMAAPATTGWALKANHTALANRVFPLKETTVIGRATECDISLVAAHLSRRHAQLSIIDGALYVKDLGSANGTFLNGKQVMEARVKRGDELRFDALSFGVMGPADELDKTSVRPNKEVVAPIAKLPPKPTFAPAQKASSQNPFKSAYEKAEEPKRSGSWKGWVVLVALFVLVFAAIVSRHL